MIQLLMEERIISSDCKGIDDFASTNEEERPKIISESISSEEPAYDSSTNMSSQTEMSIINILIMRVLMANVPRAAPGIAAMIQEANNNNDTCTEEVVKVQAEDGILSNQVK